MFVDQRTYRAAFLQYLRKGTPILAYLRNGAAQKTIRVDTLRYDLNPSNTTHYIWRTRRDGKVRSAHAARDGEVFSWDNPPPGGHPGEDHNCRCTAVPLAHDDPRLNAPARSVLPYCESLLTEIHEAQDDLAEILEQIAEFTTEERSRVEALPGAAEAYGTLILEFGFLVTAFTAAGAAMRALRVATRTASTINSVRDGMDALEILKRIDETERFAETYREAVEVWNTSELRSLLNAAKRTERRMRVLFDTWETSLCSVQVDR